MADPLKSLNVRQRKYAQGRAKGKSRKDAAEEAGYAPSVARDAKRKIENETFREAFSELIRSKIPAEKIAQRIQEGMDAMETKFFQFKGDVVDQRDVIAWSERRAYAELAAEFGNYHAPAKAIDPSSISGISFTVSFVNAGDQATTKTG